MFKQAKRSIVSPKIAFQGVSGAGKTYSALRFARGYVGENGRIAVVDTENGSASLYANVTKFDVVDVKPSPRGGVVSYWYNDFLDAIDEAEREKYDILIIDSASHIWQAVLDFKTRLDQDKELKSNQFANWGTAGLQFSAVQNKILQSQIPVICCFRTKMDYVLEANAKGKLEPKKVGLAPITRGDSEYDFSIVFDVERNHVSSVSKSRCETFSDSFQEVVTEKTGSLFRSWINAIQ